MKKAIVVLGLFLLPVIVSAQSVGFTDNLSYGSTGSEVSALQEFLIEQGVLAPQYDTGNFYSITLAAVKEFQTKEGITPVSGFVGPITRGTINSILAMEVSTSEENAATTTPPVDLSQVSSASVPVAPHSIVEPINTPITQNQTFGDIQTPTCTDTPTLSTIATSTDYNEGTVWNANFSDTCPVDTSIPVTFGIQDSNGIVLQSNSVALSKEIGDFVGTVNGFPYNLTTYGDGVFAGPFHLANYATTTSLYAFITIDGVTRTAQVQ